MTEHDEDRLRDEFRQLRSETERQGRVPDFGAMMARAKADAAQQPELELVVGRAEDGPRERRRRALVMGGWASAALAAAIAGVLLVPGQSDADAEFERLVASYSSDIAGAWASPTSSLMNVPGMNLTRSVPSVGGAVRGLDPSTLPSASESEGRDS